MHLLSGCRTVGFFVCAVCLLNACGGNGGSSGVPKPVLINYSVGGTVSGLASSASVVLQNNGGNTTTVSTNGSFIFSMQVSGGAGYGVTVVRQPPAQTCSVTGGTGIGITSSVSSIKVNCNVAIESVVHTFGLNADGLNPNSNVVKATDGNFYGVTSGGGTNLLGTVFKIAPTGTETVLYSFAGGTNDGSAPVAALVQGRDGNFYGTTTGGGANGNGTVFKLTPIGVLTVLYSFAAVPSNVGGPSSALIQGSDGNFYGTTSNGGTYNLGTFYQITPVGIETVIHSFSGILGDGSKPNAAVVQGADGNFYGTTSSAGAANGGTVFKVTPAGVETILHSFPLFATYDGCIPYAELIQAADGNFYGSVPFIGHDLFFCRTSEI